MSSKNKGKYVLIGGAWPYANGSLHLGHIAALLPGDIISRYYKLTGADVLYCSGSDCHGTPISVKAHADKTTPYEISLKYHEEFEETFKKLGIDYTIYTRTTTEFHKKEVQKMILELEKNNLLYKKSIKMAFCEKCNRFLPDRYLIGTCNICRFDSCRGDQCDKCGNLIDIEKLRNIKCTICEEMPQIRESEHLFMKISQFQNQIQKLVDENKNKWRPNAVSLTNRYLKEGLEDRAISRDLDWGIELPIMGFEDKKIYVWFEAVLGYLTASKQYSNEINDENYWQNFWNGNARAYYIHGKDNIPFHTIILPALLIGLKIKGMPTDIISSEYLTIEGKKLSTSRNWAIWANDFLERYDPDSLRYFLIINGPEKRDSDFSWNEFLERNNSELLGTYGNLVNRVLALTIKTFGNNIPATNCVPNKQDLAILEECKIKFDVVSKNIEDGELREGLKNAFDLARMANKYLDTKAPWADLKNGNTERVAMTLKTCIDVIINLSSVCYPFIPHVSAKALEFFELKPEWNFRTIKSGDKILEPEILVKRLDKSIIEEERSRLG